MLTGFFLLKNKILRIGTVNNDDDVVGVAAVVVVVALEYKKGEKNAEERSRGKKCPLSHKKSFEF